MKINRQQNSKSEMKIGNLGGKPAPQPAFALRVQLDFGDHEIAVECRLDLKPKAHWSLERPSQRSGQQGTSQYWVEGDKSPAPSSS